MNKLLFIAAMFIACSCSCDISQDTTTMYEEAIVDMENIIAKDEALLDSINATFPFMDTIGETDEYVELCETREAFELSSTFAAKHHHFTVYCKMFDTLLDNTMRIMIENEDSVTPTMVRCVYYNDN